MKKYVCIPCGYIYDPEIGDPDNGIPPRAKRLSMSLVWSSEKGL